MTISASNIRTTVWDTIYTYLKTTNQLSTSHIYSALNGKLVESVGYPFVIIFPPTVTFNKENINGQVTTHDVSVLIEIYHTSSENAKALADEVTGKLMTARRAAFVQQRMMKMEIAEGDNDSWDEGDKKIHRISFNVMFRCVIDNAV